MRMKRKRTPLRVRRWRRPAPPRRAAQRCQYPPYTRRQALLSRGELAFYHVLRRATAPRYLISMKTRLADVLACPDHLWNTPYGRRLARKHVDFVLYDPRTTAIVAVIELDDRSHRYRQRRLRDLFLTESLRAAGVPLVRIKAASAYDSTQLRETITQAVSAKAAPSDSTMQHLAEISP